MVYDTTSLWFHRLRQITWRYLHSSHHTQARFGLSMTAASYFPRCSKQVRTVGLVLFQDWHKVSKCLVWNIFSANKILEFISSSIFPSHPANKLHQTLDADLEKPANFVWTKHSILFQEYNFCRYIKGEVQSLLMLCKLLFRKSVVRVSVLRSSETREIRTWDAHIFGYGQNGENGRIWIKLDWKSSCKKLVQAKTSTQRSKTKQKKIKTQY